MPTLHWSTYAVFYIFLVNKLCFQPRANWTTRLQFTTAKVWLLWKCYVLKVQQLVIGVERYFNASYFVPAAIRNSPKNLPIRKISRSLEVARLCVKIALEFHRRPGSNSTAGETPVKFQSDWNCESMYLLALKFLEIWWQDVLSLCD